MRSLIAITNAITASAVALKAKRKKMGKSISHSRIAFSLFLKENEISFTCKLNFFYVNGRVPGLALMERLKATRKWAIAQLSLEN